MLLNCGVGEDSWNPLDCKEFQPVHPKGDQSWVLIGRTDGEAEAPILCPYDCEKLTHWKRPWCWERLKAGGEGDNRGWDGWMHRWLNGHEFEQIPGGSEGQGSLACYSPWGSQWVRCDLATKQQQKESNRSSRTRKGNLTKTRTLDFNIPWFI